MKTPPKVFKHGGDGNWRCRSQDDKGRWRTAKFIEGKHQPGLGDEPPPITDSGAFVTIPKAIRDTTAPAQPEQAAQAEPQPEPVAQPQAQPAPEPQNEPTQSPQPEPTQPEPAKETSGFPEFCADAMRNQSTPIVQATDATQAEGIVGDPVAPKPSKVEVPVVELLIDSMFSIGEGMGGPKAPKGSGTDGLSLETLRDKMVESGKAAFPAAEVEAGPKTTFFGCMGLYLYMCYTHEEFRKKAEPWYIRAKGNFASWWTRLKHRRQSKRREKEAAQPEPQAEGANG